MSVSQKHVPRFESKLASLADRSRRAQGTCVLLPAFCCPVPPVVATRPMALVNAALQGDEAQVLALLSADPPSSIAEVGGGWHAPHYLPLTAAAARGHSSIIRLLLAHGASVNSVDGDRITPLMRAAAGGRVEALELLLKEGADPAKRDGR